VDSCTAKEKADKVALKVNIEFKYSRDGCGISRNDGTQHGKPQAQ
jgi:hypothetical protein